MDFFFTNLKRKNVYENTEQVRVAHHVDLGPQKFDTTESKRFLKSNVHMKNSSKFHYNSHQNQNYNKTKLISKKCHFSRIFRCRSISTDFSGHFYLAFIGTLRKYNFFVSFFFFETFIIRVRLNFIICSFRYLHYS